MRDAALAIWGMEHAPGLGNSQKSLVFYRLLYTHRHFCCDQCVTDQSRLEHRGLGEMACLRDLIGKKLIAFNGAVEGAGGKEVRHYHGLDGRDGGQRCTDSIRSASTLVGA